MRPHDPKDPLDQVLDIAVFAPIGALLSVREALPAWVQRGRQQLSAQLPLARTVGEIAVRQGSRQARQGLDRLRRQADDLLEEMAGTKGSPGPDSGHPGPAGEEDRFRRPASEPGAPDDPEAPPPAPAGAVPDPVIEEEDDRYRAGGHPDAFESDDSGSAGGSSGPDADQLPIPGYDTLSASQVVQRLAGLSVDELEAVRRYELAGRARKTVLLRVAQLRTAS